VNPSRIGETRHTVIRLTVTTSFSLAELRERYEQAVPRVPVSEVEELVRRRAPWSEMLALVSAAAPHGFLIYHTLDVGAFLQLAGHRPGDTAYLMGNHIIAERMYRHDPMVMLHAPLRTLIWGGTDGTARFSVDQPSSYFGSYGQPEIAAVGVELDRKLAALLEHLGVDVPESLLTSGPTSTADLGA
jgi:uncharacterized protein (DUF302 family)